VAELSAQDRELAIAELERIERTLTDMSAWADGDSESQQRASIALEDAASQIRAAGWMLERIDPGRLASLVHRRIRLP